MQNIKDIAAEKKTLTSIQYLKKSIKQMKCDQFQLLFVDGLYGDSKEIEVTCFFLMLLTFNNPFRTSITKNLSVLNKNEKKKKKNFLYIFVVSQNILWRPSQRVIKAF